MSYICTEKTTIQERIKEIEQLKKRIQELEKENEELKRILHIKYNKDA